MPLTASLRLLRRSASGSQALVASLAVLQARGLAMKPPAHLPQGLGRPSGPSTAATGSRSGLGNFGGAKADYDEKFPQGPGSPAPDLARPLGQPDPDEAQRNNPDLLLTPHGYKPVQGPMEE